MSRIGSQHTRKNSSGPSPVTIRELSRRIQNHDVKLALALRQSTLGRFDGVTSVGITAVEEKDPRPYMNGLLITPGSKKLLPLLQ
jgi:hypothetical protein